MSMVSAKAEWQEGNGEYLLHDQFDKLLCRNLMGHEMRFRSLLPDGSLRY
jgi:hypothetical protein